MARPMILIKFSLLSKLYDERQLGVPLQKLIANHHLPIKHPTLSKILEYYDSWKVIASKSDTKEEYAITANIISASLFPNWLSHTLGDVTKQPADWYYEGQFPLGKWKQRDASIPTNS